MSLGGSLEQLEQIAIGVNALGLRAHVFFERREDPFLQTRQMYVQPVVVPVKLFRIPGQQLLFVFADASEKRAHVVGAKDVSVLDRERTKHIKRF